MTRFADRLPIADNLLSMRTATSIELAYGRGHITLDPPVKPEIIEPRFVQGLRDEKGVFADALRRPIGAQPLAEWLEPSSTVAIVFTDITRATPNERLIPWLLEELVEIVAPGNITLINGLGTHRPNTSEELNRLRPDGDSKPCGSFASQHASGRKGEGG
jgi:nickel-dependent lactate racemase